MAEMDKNESAKKTEEAISNLFEDVMKGSWKKVVESYETYPEAWEAKITRTEDTVLHLAVFYGRTENVLKMLEAIKDVDTFKKILRIRNERGNTALHLAAQLGDVRMCSKIASRDEMLITARNAENETPLFSAALHGNNSTFLYLQSVNKRVQQELHRRKGGDTILHAALSGEYLDLAYQIIYCYPELVDYHNENGQSPLHILAGKPNLFKSSDHQPGLFDSLIYKCITVDLLKEEKHRDEAHSPKPSKKKARNPPENYRTCMDFYNAPRPLFRWLSKQSAFRLPVWNRTEDTKPAEQENPQTDTSSSQGKDRLYFPPNYATIALYFKLTMKALLIFLGIGILWIQKMNEKKQRYTWANQVMHELVNRASSYKYDHNGRKPPSKAVSIPEVPPELSDTGDQISSRDENGQVVAAKMGVTDAVSKFLKTFPVAAKELESGDKNLVLLTFEKKPADTETMKWETPFLIAAKMGVTEMVEEILKVFPVAIQDLDPDNKNAVLLAVENRQPHVYSLLLKKEMTERAFRQVDSQGNSALHLAAMAGGYRPWLIPGAALQMQWELKWYKFVETSMQRHSFATYNKKGQTPEDVFKETHRELIKSGSEWLTKTSESYSVVAALIATVAFSTSSNIPGGVNEQSGAPKLGNEPAFNVFAISSVVALCCSVTALVFFLAILTSRFQEKNFATDLPRKLLLGLTSLFTSIASILVSFCAGHFFVLGDKVRNAAYPIYAATCFPVTFFVLAQLPLYFDLIQAIVKKVPQRSYKDFPQ